MTEKTRAEEVAEVLDSCEAITELSSDARDKLYHLALHPGFRVLQGVLIAERQGLLVQLSHAPAATPAEVQRLGVLQGTVRGIERVHGILLESTSLPTDEDQK